MVSRRRFLSWSGVGALSLTAGCYPPLFQQQVFGDDTASDALREKRKLKGLKNRVLGYPINMNDPPDGFFSWRKELFEVGLDAFAFNNVGNPFKPSPIPYNSHDFERETIRHFGKLYGFPTDDTWGFLSHSGTDSNMHGMYMGRTILKGKTGTVPKAYFTHEAHYSVQILRDLLGVEAEIVDTLSDGSMDPDDLATRLSANPKTPALVVATMGTTFKGAFDNVDRIREVLGKHPSYMHVDAALFGGYLPFTDHAAQVSFGSTASTSTGRYDSIAVSCHKFFGFPSPAGLFVTTRSIYDEFNSLFSRIHNPEYIHQVPGTITCSRDAVKPAEFYYFTTEPARKMQKRDAGGMLENTRWFLEQMHSKFPQYSATRSNPLSNTVYFRYPGEKIVKKYSLATMQLGKQKKSRFAHIVIMPHVSQEVLGEFLSDLQQRKNG